LYNANVVCPITESLAGTHTFVTSNMKAAGVACGTTVTGSVVFGATATPGVYTISDLLECSVQVATEITLRLGASSK
jgi:hypothetical protein